MPQVIKEANARRYITQADGSTTTEERPVKVYVHCVNQQCGRYHDLQHDLDFEREVPGFRTETFHAFADRGGDMPGVENSFVQWEPAHNEDKVCEECLEPVNASPEPSRRLTKHTFRPGEGLEGAQRAAALAAAKVAQAGADKDASRDVEVDELRRQLAEIKAALPKEAA